MIKTLISFFTKIPDKDSSATIKPANNEKASNQ